MKQIIVKSALKRTMALMLLTLVLAPASAQYYMNVVQKNGQKEQYLVSNIDSVYFSDQEKLSTNYEYVDLGLSVKWATFNVGATKPEEYGNYFAWGETEPKADYSLETYKWFNYNGSYFTKYIKIRGPHQEFKDDKFILDSDDDVAHIKWGGAWRMPTKEELEDLWKNCTWAWTTENGVNGYTVTSKREGFTNRSIFLPAAGNYYSDGIVAVGNSGLYWSNEMSAGDGNINAYSLFFHDSFVDVKDYYNRSCGLSIRPVFPSEDWLSSITINFIEDNKTLVVGGCAVLDIDVKQNGAIFYYNLDHNLEMFSNDPSVAVVDQNGVVTALSVGTATITAKYKDKTALCTITVLGDESEVEHEYVDLGLSVKWATFNVGALSIEDYGAHYAWGETESKMDYSCFTYKFRLSGDSWNNVKYDKYNTNSSYGTVDNKTTLDPEDDVAHVKWGGNWRMPTAAEQEELLNNCTWIWYDRDNIEFNGIEGFKGTSKKEGYTDCFIFLPAAGKRQDRDFNLFGLNQGLYWSSSLDTDNPNSVWVIGFGRYDENYGMYLNGRGVGYSVRPVCP